MDFLNPPNDPSFPARTVAYTGTAGNTGTWPAGPAGVLVWATSAAYVKVGVGAVATVTDMPIPANAAVLIKVDNPTAQPWRVSAIQIASLGDVFAKPMNGASD